MYKLVAVDLDGTLLNEEGKLSERTIKAVAAVRKKGLHIVLTSGRPFEGMQDIIKGLELEQQDEYVISFGGSLVHHMRDGKLIAKLGLVGQDLKNCYQMARKMEVGCQAFVKEGVIAPNITSFIQKENDGLGLQVQQRDFMTIADTEEVVKFMFVDAPDVIDALEKKLPESFLTQYTVVRSMPGILEVLNPLAGKWQGILALINYLGILPQEVVAMGDELNDIEMLQGAGLGIAMGNARDQVKKAADYVALRNDEEGAAVVLEQLLA